MTRCDICGRDFPREQLRRCPHERQPKRPCDRLACSDGPLRGCWLPFAGKCKSCAPGYRLMQPRRWKRQTRSSSR